MPYADKDLHKEKLRAYRRKWYAENAERAKSAIYLRRAEVKSWYDELKATMACANCGENHPAVLDFHHRGDQTKDLAVSQAINNGWSKDRILAEIEKCDVLCSNCHRIVHHEQRQT